MPFIGKILFPVDFSESCIGAARHVEFFAGRFEAEIMLLHVVGPGEHALPEEIFPARKAQLDAFLAADFKYFTTHRVCVQGYASEEIEHVTKSWRPDILMMPTHGLGYFRRFLLGSVTAKALHDLDCPVWTSVHAETSPPLEQIRCRRILCAVDLSERSLMTLQWAARLANESQACLGIVYAAVGVDAAAYGREFAEYLLAQEKTRIETLQAETGTTAEVFIIPGDATKIVASVASNWHADLMVIGRHGSNGIAGHIFQTAYSIMRESPCPVVSI
jgi:nucleotide-binding universal stress UspA family protein